MAGEDCLIFSLSQSSLADKVSKKLDIPLSEILIKKFADGEVFCKPSVSVRNKRVFIIQSTSNPVNDNLMTLLIAIDAFKRAVPKEINVIIPYFGYSRQDRKSSGREPITAKLTASLIETAGATRVLLVEIHAPQIQGFFDIPLDHIETTCVISKALSSLITPDTTIVSPDYGGVKRARAISEFLKTPVTIIEKSRAEHNQTKVMSVLGKVGSRGIIVDDMIDTGGTIIKAAEALKERGVKEIYLVATHGLFSGNAVNDLSKAHKEGIIHKVYVTDTIENSELDNLPFLERITISDFLADILKIYITQTGSISKLYASERNFFADSGGWG